ncbi:MAG: SAM-dependent methyltransferase [Muribaculaceae bacterium]|nr:SAM-dependent methyltransferase [Muribaculaceae bacterium]MDE6008425.1 SAM-dependent methyltransferase [Muribaculaceae bacterium]
MELNTALYLIPVNISNAPLNDTLPPGNLEILRGLHHLIVENVRTARRFLKRCDPGFDISAVNFYELNRHTDLAAVGEYLEPLRNGEPMGVMSEAGCPAVADPGALPVSIAQREGLRVIPLVGPSSILMALMASGFNGQGFAFNGYLPIDGKERERKLKELETASRRSDMTQIFIETPYRNNRMLKVMADTLQPSTRICVACDITDPEKESIITLPASKWKGRKYDYDKRPAIFLIYAGNKSNG